MGSDTLVASGPHGNPSRRRVTIPGTLITFVLLVYAALIVLPLMIPVMFVFKTKLEFQYHPWALPNKIVWFNFVEAWKAIRIDLGLLNTSIVCLGAVSITVTSAALAGYIFARYRSAVTEVIFYLVLAGYFVPVQMVLIPLFRMSANLGLTNSLVGLFMPIGTFGIPFWSLIYRSFYRKLPEELANAATVLAMLLSFLGAWSDYLISLILLSKPRLFTMQLRVATFLNQYGVDNMPRYAAAIIISAAPTILLYVAFHRWIIRGTLAGAIKG